MHLLHIDSSALGVQSVTRELSAAVVAHWREALPALQVTTRDVDADPLPHFTGRTLAKTDPAETDTGQQLLEEFMHADVVVIGAPMYNFGIPSTLKAWIDRIVVAGQTFRYTDTGPVGLVRGKTVVIASGRGGLYLDSPADFQEPYLRQVFAFLGITDITFVRAEGVAYSAQHRADALAAAHAQIDAVDVPAARAA